MSRKSIPQQNNKETILSHYDRLVSGGQIRNDDAQREVLAALEALQSQLAELLALSRKPGLFKKQAAAPRGLYIWGNVGRGKSMLMELFYAHAPVDNKRRVHFHAFMQEVHGRIHALRQDGSGDPVARLARQIAQETALLCFDELQATDVADATLLYRLFQGLFAAGVTVVSTSNHPPASLYTGGVQRERFEPFIALLGEYMNVIALSNSADYRRIQMKALQQVYFTPLGAGADRFIDTVIEHLCGNRPPRQEILAVQGRHTPITLYDESIGRFTFHDLCESALGPADYLALARRLDTVIVTGIPKLPPEKRNEAKRFVTLVDALYEQKTQLICTAATAPEDIYADGDGSFEFRRTASRLAEMQSENYLSS